MDPRKLFLDERQSLLSKCVYCGSTPETVEHVPSKVLLDEPYPDNLPVVPACKDCNNAFSLDEEYLACFVECVICDSTDSTKLTRPNVQRILRNKPKLRKYITDLKQKTLDESTSWLPDTNRLKAVISKLAIGHIAYEYYPHYVTPKSITFTPYPQMTASQRKEFEHSPTFLEQNLLPEIGTRAFDRVRVDSNGRLLNDGGWRIIQPNRYRYTFINNDFLCVKIVLSEYFACEIKFFE